MKLLEYEAKDIFKKYGIFVAKGIVVKKTDKSGINTHELGDEVVLKAQVDVGGRGKAGGVVICSADEAEAKADEMFAKDIKGVPVETVLLEEKLPIDGEYFVSITIDRSKKSPVILFSAEGGVDIEETSRTNPDALRRVIVSPMLEEIPDFMMRDLLRDSPKELGPAIKSLYRVFCKSDAILAEINPLVTTEKGVYAADAKIIVDDNALMRQGISVNRDLTERERIAEEHGFSYVELDGEIGVVGNGAGLTMSTLDMIGYFGGKAANFLDVGGGADRKRVCSAVRLVAGMEGVKVIVVNLLGGITRCDEVAAGIVEAGVSQQVVVRLAGTNEAEGRKILSEKGYRMLDSMEEVVKFAVEEVV